MKDDISVGTGSTGSLSESDDDDDSVTDLIGDSLEKSVVASSVGFFKAKPTALRLQRSDAHEAQVLTERLAAIHREKEDNAALIKEQKVIFLDLRVESSELEEKISQEAEMLKQLIESKTEENRLLNAALVEERKVIKPLYTQEIEAKATSFPATLWRNFYTAIYHMIGWKTPYDTLIEKITTLYSESEGKEKIIEANIKDIAEQKETVKLNARDYRIRRAEIEKELPASMGEKKLLEVNNKALENEEVDLISQLPTFQNKQKIFNQAISRMIKSCEQLTKKTMLSRVRKEENPSGSQAVAGALSNFLKAPTDTTQKSLATCIRDNPEHTEDPKLQELLEEASGYYSEVGEMLEHDEPRPDTNM